jgi:hypothetical protein
MSFHDWEIEGGDYLEVPSRIAEARVPGKVSPGFRVVFSGSVL